MIDELCDLIEAKSISKKEEKLIINELVKLLKTEKESSVIESIFNLFALELANDTCSIKIANTSAKYLQKLDAGSLYHALPIIAESNLLEKKMLITPYIKSENSAIRELAQKILTLLN
jgi:hypothetical protein